MAGWDESFEKDPPPFEDRMLYSFNEVRSERRIKFWEGLILASMFWLTVYAIFGV